MTEFKDMNPPEWGEPILWVFLKPGDRDSVTGDLLEEYREMILAGRDRAAANRWYLRQVAGFLWRSTWAWAAAIAALGLGRGTLDALVPPASFYTPSVVTDGLLIAVFVVIGFRAAWRGRPYSGSLPESLANSVAAVLSTQITACLMIFVGELLFLGIWHDTQTLTAIERSGGFGEMFFLPAVITAPAVLLSLVGGSAALILPRRR
jgi:hypothetical protein